MLLIATITNPRLVLITGSSDILLTKDAAYIATPFVLGENKLEDGHPIERFSFNYAVPVTTLCGGGYDVGGGLASRDCSIPW